MNKSVKKIWCFFLCVVMIISVTACSKVFNENGPEIQTQEEQNQETENQEVENQEGEPIVLIDQAGREVTLDGPAQTIVSSYYITTYASIALGVEDRLVGIESKADSRTIYQMAAPELLELPSVGTLKEFDLEATAALKPDLVILPKKLIDYAQALTDLSIPVLVVYPESQDLLEEMLSLISTACGVEENGDKLLSYYEETLNEIEAITTQVENKASVYMAGNSSYLTTAPDGMYQSTLITLAGGINAAAEIQGDYWSEVSYEDILAMNPDVIILPATAEYSVDDILNDIQLSDVTAVKEGMVYQMPVGIEEWDSPIPSGVLGIRWLCSVLHNELYSFEDMQNDVVAYYKNFYGFDLDTNMITK